MDKMMQLHRQRQMLLPLLLLLGLDFVVEVHGKGKCQFQEFEDRDELWRAVDIYMGDGEDARKEVKKTYGAPIGKWCVGKVTDFTSVFSGDRNPEVGNNFNEDLNGWDMSNAKTTKYMFVKAKVFNGAIGSWDTSKVENMAGMFSGAEEFNQDLSSWDVGEVKHMENMFSHAFEQEKYSFNGDISTWDTKNVVFMKAMFRGSTAFNQDLRNWNVAKVQNMKHMFEETTLFNGDISTWDVSGVKDMTAMFREAKSFNSDLSKWKTTNVVDMSNMFQNCTKFNADLSRWDVSNVGNMKAMFNGAESFDADLVIWDVGNVKSFDRMFVGAKSFSRDLCPWGYILQKNIKDVDEGKITFSGIFKDTGCESQSDPKITKKDLSYGFCVEECPKEKDFEFPVFEEPLEELEEKREFKKETRKIFHLFKTFFYLVLLFGAAAVVVLYVRQQHGGPPLPAPVNAVVDPLVSGATMLAEKYNYSNAFGLIDTSRISHPNHPMNQPQSEFHDEDQGIGMSTFNSKGKDDEDADEMGGYKDDDEDEENKPLGGN